MNPRQQTIKSLLEIYGARPKKRLGQNFLIDKRALEKILLAANLNSQDTVLEIGPGIGTLTLALAQKAKMVIAIEKDPKMIEILKGVLSEVENVEIIQGDILKNEILNPTLRLRSGQASEIRNKSKTTNTKYKILNTRYKVVANLPYYITSPVIRKFLEAPRKPKLMVLMAQKEVAQRICAKPPDMTLLAVSVQFYGEPKIVSYVKRTSFWPQPAVDSAILKIVPHHTPTLKLHGRRFPMHSFFALVKAGFAHPRKQLLNNLSKGLNKTREETVVWLKENGVNPNQRAESLSLQDWINLTKSAIIEA